MKAAVKAAFAVLLLARGAAGNCRGLDRSALIRLYDALGGPDWVNNRNWNTSTGTSAQNKANDPCDPNQRWYGVGFIDPCEKYLDDIVGSGPQTDYLTRIRGSGQGCFAGRITSLNLRRNNLRGNLTVPELGDLQNLTYLDLSWNGLEGAIPTEIGRLNNVQIINLAHNNISGELPTELGTLNSQGPLANAGCGLDDPCPLGVQLKLTDLTLHHNMITGPIPSQLVRAAAATPAPAPPCQHQPTRQPPHKPMPHACAAPSHPRATRSPPHTLSRPTPDGRGAPARFVSGRARAPQAARPRQQQPHGHGAFAAGPSRSAPGALPARELAERLAARRGAAQSHRDALSHAPGVQSPMHLPPCLDLLSPRRAPVALVSSSAMRSPAVYPQRSGGWSSSRTFMRARPALRTRTIGP